MTTASESTLWLQLFALLAVEVGVIAMAGAVLQRWAPSAAWRRTVWQAAMVSVLGIALCELSGSGRGVASWALMVASGQAAVAPPAPKYASKTDEAKAPQLNTDFRAPARERLVANESHQLNSQNHPETKPISGNATEAPSSSGSTMSLAATQTAVLSPAGSTRSHEFVSVGWCLLVWLLGVAIVLGRVALARCLFTLFRRRRSVVVDPAFLQRVGVLSETLGMRRRVRVIQSARLSGPIAFGLLRPTVALPQDFTERFDASKQDAMLAHELAHLAAHDSFWYLLADLSVSVLWWHPAVWWLRRQLHKASESAADDASLLLTDGPRVLAECLVEMGGHLTRPEMLGGLGVAGFRSHLGQRVQRLLNLKARTWSPPRRLYSTLARTLGAMAMVAVVILCSAWVAPRALTKGDNMKTLQKGWKQSLATVALLAAFHSPNTIVAADTTETRATTAAGGVTTAPMPPAYVGGGSGYALAPRETTKVDSPIEARLKSIRLAEVSYDGLPLSEVLRNLRDEVGKRDPNHPGVNFLINPNPPPSISSGQPVTIDPSTGLPIPVPTEPVDLSSVSIKFNMPLRDITVKDLLDAVVKVADHPIQYTFEDYADVFSLKPEATVPQLVHTSGTAPTASLSARTFLVPKPEPFVAGLQSAFGIKLEDVKNETSTPNSRQIQLALKELMRRLGVSQEGDKSVFYNGTTGIVMVRGTAQDLDVAAAAIETLGGIPTAFESVAKEAHSAK